MLLKQSPPELALFQPNKSTPISQIIAPMHIDTTYRFGTASEIQFKIQKYLYDEQSGKWYKNPSYDDVVSNNLICSSEDSSIYKFKGCKLLASNEYGYKFVQSRARDSSSTGLFFLVDMNGCTLQDEYAIYNLGCDYGYNWKSGTYINNSGAVISAPKDPNYTYNEVLEEFFPVEVGDIISLGSRPYNGLFKKDAAPYYSYRIHYYTDADATTQTKVTDEAIFNPVGRVIIKDGDFGYEQFAGMGHRTVKNYIKKGYVRLELRCQGNGVSYPAAWYAVIISGEKHCTKVNVQTNSDGTDKYFNVEFGAQWWVIKDIEEEIDGYNSSKTVTAYSYEYTMSDKTFSIEECTLPLYIPDEIPEAVTKSAYYCIDSCDGTNYYGRQRMERGLINRILDICPQWSVGYVTPNLLTRYRSVPDCTEVNIYSFLLSTVQELYKCFIIFDTSAMTINLIDKDDIVSINSNTMISWRNALKTLNITNTDTNYVTALRVHAGDDTYGIGLVNPNGTNVIYNFDNIINKLDYVADSGHLDDNGVPYTLKNRWNAYKSALTDIQNGTLSVLGETILSAQQRVINGQFEIVEIEKKLSEALTNYQKLADRINVTLDYNDDDTSKRLPDVPIQNFTGDYAPSTSTNPNTGVTVTTYNNYSSEILYNEIVEASQLYYSALATYSVKKHDLEGAINDLKEFAIKLSISPNVLQPIFDIYRVSASSNLVSESYFPIFTPTEAKELSKYIIEGTWTNDNVVFTEDYNATDIITTLTDVYNAARSEFNNIYSKPTFDFSATIAGILATDEAKNMFRNLALGNSLYIVDDSQRKQFDYITPVLLSVHVGYDDWSNTSFELSTDYKRKPLEIRFTELFGMISQTNPSNASYAYND